MLVLEARDRIGGRCWTRRLPGLSAPVELGAEFIHGRPEVTLALLKRAQVAGVDSIRTQRFLERGRLREANAFAAAQKAVRETRALKARDLSFAEFLSKKKISPSTRKLATMMVEGFDAADPARVSAREIAEEWEGGSLDGSQMRPQGGYGPLLETFLTGRFRVALGRPVREVRWEKGAVEVDGVQARCAIVTLPLGVLQAGTVRFTPELHKPSIEKLASGPVIRVALRFEEAFWEERCPGVAFFHNPAAPFPTFWTPLPTHAPLLTAWAGGPQAARLSGLGEKQLIGKALASIRSIFRRVPRVESALVQDWQADAHARGGYSYVLVGGQGAREELRKPVGKTLFFAGEATDPEEAGTVAGALRSGLRAAQEVLKS